MSQSYVKQCIFCQKKIRMSDQKEGKWFPYNKNGSAHECKKKNGNGNDIGVEVLLKKLESIGITLDLNKLRNVK